MNCLMRLSWLYVEESKMLTLLKVVADAVAVLVVSVVVGVVLLSLPPPPPQPDKVMIVSVRKRRRGDGKNGRKGEKRKKFLLPVKTD